VIEGINMIGSVFYGPILAAFICGVLFRRVDAIAMITGVVVGVGVNLAVAMLMGDIFWMWWNMIGFFVAAVVALVVGQFTPTLPADRLDTYTLSGSVVSREKQKEWAPYYLILIVYFFVIFGIMIFLNHLSGA
jgi:SSS family solute:Na+ symporter